MSEKLIVEELSPLEGRALVERLSDPSLRDNFVDGKYLVILDVRTAQEYVLGHLKGSINLDFKSPSFRDEIARLDRDKAYLLYCRTGNRSGRVIVLMSSLGFKELYNLTKGIEQWQREGYEVISG